MPPTLALLLALLPTLVLASDDCTSHAPSPPGYDPTRCHPIGNASALPRQCLGPVWSLDPPCPRCWTNEAEDYVPGVSPTALSPALRGKMQAALDTYLLEMEARRYQQLTRKFGGS